jgi:hypothetical protein
MLARLGITASGCPESWILKFVRKAIEPAGATMRVQMFPKPSRYSRHETLGTITKSSGVNRSLARVG